MRPQGSPFSNYAEALFEAVARTSTLCLDDLSADDAPSTCKPCAHQCESRGRKSGFIVQRRLRLSSALCRRIGRTIKDYARAARRSGADIVKKLHGNAFPQVALYSAPYPPLVSGDRDRESTRRVSSVQSVQFRRRLRASRGLKKSFD